jgi:transcriptional regulator with XRE-family HTH domain
VDKRTPFLKLGLAIAAARTDAGLTQNELAHILGVRQQSVSRWEAGSHHPAPRKLSDIEDALKIERGSLARLTLASTHPVRTIAPHLPLGSLAPELFERFVADLFSALYPGRTVRVQGGTGHDQRGWDVLVTGEGETIGIQCKRQNRFGPADVVRAVHAVETPVDRSILALSRIASPGAAEAAAAAGWDIWDQDDISRRVRFLPGERQDKLVDIYFSGQRLALLGRDNPGPWLQTERFFAPFAKAGSPFSHHWGLVGRDADLDQLGAALSAKEPVIILSGAAGMGKSRLLRSAIETYATENPRVLLRFLSPVGELDHASLEALGTTAKLLVVDDAHDREGLPLLVNYAADPANRTRLLLASRPYALQRIRNDLNRYGIFEPVQIKLGKLPKAAMRKLVVEALQSYGGSGYEAWADAILSISSDNPLVAVMAARVATQGNLTLEEIRSDERMQIVVRRFGQGLTRGIGHPDDRRLLRDMLGLLALLQPVQVDDREIGELLAAVTAHLATDATRALRLLIDGGVLYKRGRHYRLMPDLLGDHLIDDVCVQTDGRLSLFAERVLGTIDDRLLPNVMVNLGRLDWRRSGGDPSDSRLLESAWARFRGIENDWDPRVDAIRKVAVYQPAQALRFVSDHLRDGNAFTEISGILENIVYTDHYRADALELLWAMARTDLRNTGPHPKHPARVLAELTSFGAHKPPEFLNEMIDFAFGLMDDEQNWVGPHTPLEIVMPILKGTIDMSHGNARSITLASAFVNYEFGAPMRKRVIDKMLDLLEHPSTRIATSAGRHLNEAVSIPYGIGSASPSDALRRKYETEFAATIRRVTERMESYATPVLLEIANSISWHADYGADKVKDAARKFLGRLPADPAFRLRAAMVDRAQFAFPYKSEEEEEHLGLDRIDKINGLAKDMLAAWPDPDALLDAIEEASLELADAGVSDGSAYLLLNDIVADNIILATALLARAETNATSPLRRHVWKSMAELMKAEPDRARDRLLGYLATDADMAARTIVAIGSSPGPVGRTDLAMLARALTSKHPEIVRAGISTLSWSRTIADEDLKSLALLVRFEDLPDLTNDVFSLLVEGRKKLIAQLSKHEIDTFLARLHSIKSFEGRWVEELFRALAEHFPLAFASFLFERTDRALEDSERSVEFLGYRFNDGNLGFHKSPEANEILNRAWAWLRTHDDDDGLSIYRVVQLFAGMFDIDADNVVAFLDMKIDRATPIELKWVAKLVRHTHYRFPFAQRRFVERLLDRCAVVDRDALEMAIDLLTGAAMSGMRSGLIGEPTKRDIQARQDAQDVLATMPRLAPAYPLYRAILKDADQQIADSIREGADLDDDEDEDEDQTEDSSEGQG